MSARLDSLSIVIPLYNEQANLEELRTRLARLLSSMDFASVEVLLVDDGSTDRTAEIIHHLAAQDSRFVAISLTRNFGHQAALSVGLELSQGDVVAVIDGDLQDPPEQIPVLLCAIRAGADVAYGVRQRRKEGWLKRVAYAGFYRVLRRVADIDIPVDSGDFCVMRRSVVNAMLMLPERTRFVRGIRAWVGYKQIAVPYERAARFAGKPAYSWTKLIQLALNGLFAFTSLPVRIAQILGFLISAAAIVVAAGYLALFYARPDWFPPGFATLTISIWLLAGVQLFFLGLLGEYLVRTFDEVRQRPTALVARVSRNLSVAHALDQAGDTDPVATGSTITEAARSLKLDDAESRVVALVQQLQDLLQDQDGLHDDVVESPAPETSHTTHS